MYLTIRKICKRTLFVLVVDIRNCVLAHCCSQSGQINTGGRSSTSCTTTVTFVLLLNPDELASCKRSNIIFVQSHVQMSTIQGMFNEACYCELCFNVYFRSFSPSCLRLFIVDFSEFSVKVMYRNIKNKIIYRFLSTGNQCIIINRFNEFQVWKTWLRKSEILST